MNGKIEKAIPYSLILLGLFLLFFMGRAIVAGVCLLFGVVMIFEKIWPEEWEAEKKKENKTIEE